MGSTLRRSKSNSVTTDAFDLLLYGWISASPFYRAFLPPVSSIVNHSPDVATVMTSVRDYAAVTEMTAVVGVLFRGLMSACSILAHWCSD